MNTRIYVVVNSATGEKRLVEATSQSAAIRHCVQPVYRAETATALTVANLCTTGGLKLERANEQQTATT